MSGPLSARGLLPSRRSHAGGGYGSTSSVWSQRCLDLCGTVVSSGEALSGSEYSHQMGLRGQRCRIDYGKPKSPEMSTSVRSRFPLRDQYEYYQNVSHKRHKQ